MDGMRTENLRVPKRNLSQAPASYRDSMAPEVSRINPRFAGQCCIAICDGTLRESANACLHLVKLWRLITFSNSVLYLSSTDLPPARNASHPTYSVISWCPKSSKSCLITLAKDFPGFPCDACHICLTNMLLSAHMTSARNANAS